MTLATTSALDIARAAGPFVAAVVALYIALRSEWREHRKRPELSLRYDHASDDFETGVINFEGVNSHWVRLRVVNRSGRRTAQDVEVHIVGVAPRTGAASLEGFYLMWSNLAESGLPDRSAPYPSRQAIAPGAARHIDICGSARMRARRLAPTAQSPPA